MSDRLSDDNVAGWLRNAEHEVAELWELRRQAEEDDSTVDFIDMEIGSVSAWRDALADLQDARTRLAAVEAERDALLLVGLAARFALTAATPEELGSRMDYLSAAVAGCEPIFTAAHDARTTGAEDAPR